ncbi:MAG: metallophosphoesterase [Ignavibacteriaceae bacterium]|nr:metallophosphoesterase [Ignavibacteriaceae bacterium]
MKIIHLSDLHISKDFRRNNLKRFKYCLNHICQTSFDHLAITGDLTDNAQHHDFTIIRQTLKHFGLLDSSKVSIVIGNHDIFGGVQTALDVLEFPKKCKTTDYDEKVSSFISHFEELFTDCSFSSPNKFFPYYKNLGEVGLIGLNSVAHFSKIGNPIASTGKVYHEQITDFKLLTKDITHTQPIIALIHHHFYKKTIEATSPQNNVWNKFESYNLRLRNKKKLIKVLSEAGIKLVLHGHSHEMTQYSRKGIHFLNAGGAIDNNSNIIRYFEIDINNLEYNVTEEKLSIKNKLTAQKILSC